MRIWLLGFSGLLFTTPAVAEVTKVPVGFGKRATLNSAYRKGNEVRVYAAADGSTFPTELMRVAVTRIAEMTKARRLPRFAITKISECGTMTMNSIRVSTSCRLLGRMLAESEVAKPEGKRQIVYFRTDDVLAGRMMPEGGPFGF